MNMKIGRKILFYLLLAVILTGILLLFSVTTSPLYPNNYGVDSAFNRFMGLMVRRGKVLYSEIWDNKGPLLFFLQAIGTLKGTHNADVTLTFLMQVFSLCFSFFLLIRSSRELKPSGYDPFRLLIPVIAAVSVFCMVIDSGNLCEEWSLPMISCSLCLMMKYAARVKDDPLHPRRYAFAHGVCFALLAFIRVNNAVSICAGVLVIGVYLALREKWENLRDNLLFGLLGVAAVALPVLAYFLWKHALGDMLYSVFIYNLKYASQRTHKTFTGTDWLVRFLPMITSFLLIIIGLIRTRRFRFQDVLVLVLVSVNTVMLWSSNIFLHYYIVFVPVFLLVLILYADFPKIPELVITLMVCVFFIQVDLPLLTGLPDAKNEPDRFAYAASIPEDEKKSAMVLYATPAVYLNSGLIPCSRFAAYHFAHFPVDPAMKAEFLEDMAREQPMWIVYLSGYEDIITEVKNMLDAGYEKVHEEYDISYYRRMDPAVSGLQPASDLIP